MITRHSPATVGKRVVAGYRDRATFARAEVRPIVPHLLTRALGGVEEVVEFPCGTGHFLTAYAQAGVRVRLVDGSEPMLTEAVHHAHRAGVGELAIGRHLLHDLPMFATTDLVLVPNGALNQLAAQSDPSTVLTLISAAVPTGCRLLLQVVDPTGDGIPFYSPTLPDGAWHHDHTFPAPNGRMVRRHRWQHHLDRSRVEVGFAYTTGPHDPHTPEHSARVDLALPSLADLYECATTAGWVPLRQTSHRGFLELLFLAQEGEP